MKTRILVGLALVAVLAAAIYWKWGRPAPRLTPEPAVATPSEPAPKKRPDNTGAAKRAPEAPLELLADDDPDGSLRLEGLVLDSQELPVAGASVTVSANPPRTVESLKDGSFAFDRLLPREYTLSARKDGLVGGPVSQNLSDTSDPVVIRLTQGADLTVRVVGDGDAPVASARVRLRQSDEREAVCDKRGVARFAGVASGFAVVVASADGYGVAHQPVTVPEAGGAAVEVRVVLRAGAQVAGVVRDDAGQAIEGARVVPYDASAIVRLENPRLDGVRTGADGRFELPALSAGSYRFTATHEDHAPGSSEPITIDGLAAVRDVEITLRRGGVLTGTVVDKAGRAVAFARVNLRAGSAGGAGISVTGGARQATTGEDGRFRVAGLARTELTVLALSESAASDVVTVDLTGDGERDVTLTLTVDGAISGRVVDSAGEPVAEAQVNAFPDIWGGEKAEDLLLRGLATDITDGDGRFALKGLRAGTYRVRASRSSIRTLQFVQPGVRAETGDKDVELVLDQPGGIAGSLRFKDGGAPAAFTVIITVPPGTPVIDEQGAFAVGELPPGKYDVSFRGVGFAVRRVRDVEVRAGATTDMGVIEVERGRSAIGFVRDSGGNGVAGASVYAARQLVGDGRSSIIDVGTASDEVFGVLRTTTAEDGSFRLVGLGKGELQIIAEHETAGRSLPQAIAAGAKDVTYELVVQPYGSATGTITVGGKPAPGASVIAAPRGGGNIMLVVRTGEDGSFTYERLGSGSYRFTANILRSLFGSSTSAGKDAEIVQGRSVRVDIDVAVGDVELTVLVQGKDGATIDAAQVFVMAGRHAPANAKELTDVFLAGQSGGIMQTLATDKAVFGGVAPGEYSVCVIPINGDLRDPNFQTRLQEHANQLAVYCQVTPVAATPDKQSLTAIVPPMQPLSEDETPAPPAAP